MTMGRLDDAAKHKVVELRKAGLSFRKIKAVLELENIKVSAQAIYLYLREVHGRPPGRVKPVEVGGATLAAQVQAQTSALRESWSNIHLQNLIRDVSHQAERAAPTDFAKQASTNSEASAMLSVSEESGRNSRPEHQRVADQDANDIQIVSVTSLAQRGQQRVTQPTVTSAQTSAVSSTLPASAAFIRRRVTPSPATSSMLAARKRLLDKALSHKTKVAPLVRRDFSGVQSSGLSTGLVQPPQTYDLTMEKIINEGQAESSNSLRRFPTQRPGLSVRSLQPPPRVGIRLPNRPLPPLTTSVPGAVLRLQSPRSQGVTRSEGSPSTPQAIPDTRGRGTLQDQIQTLGSEVRSLGLAVKMLIEQQCRLEREQSQQTQIQKQILSTLQTIASKAGHCNSVQHQLNKTPSLSALPAASASTSFSQDTYNFAQGTYTQCNQTEPSYNSLESLGNVEAFKVPGLSPSSINEFPPCSNTESLPLTHTPPQTQPYASEYSQQTSQTHIPPYTQSYVSTYSQAHTHTFRTPESKTADFSTSCSTRTFADCNVSPQQVVNANHSSHDQQINNIKVEGP